MRLLCQENKFQKLKYSHHPPGTSEKLFSFDKLDASLDSWFYFGDFPSTQLTADFMGMVGKLLLRQIIVLHK